MSKAALKLAYLNTVYTILLGEHQYDIKIGMPAPDDVRKILKTTNIKTGYILTACNPQSQPLTHDENKIRNSKLKADLVDLECMVIDAAGTGQDPAWSPEKSFFIIGINAEQIEQLAVKYGQNAYVKVEVEQPTTLVFSAVWN